MFCVVLGDILWFQPIFKRYDNCTTHVTTSPLRYRDRDRYRIFTLCIKQNTVVSTRTRGIQQTKTQKNDKITDWP